MKIKKFLKGRLATFVALIAALICAGIAAFVGAFGGLGSVQTASANASGTSYSLGTGGSITGSSLASLMGKIMGSSSAKSYNELKAYMDKDSDHARKGSEIGAQVSLGGQTWNVAYASQTRGGDVVATLWLASSSATSQWNKWYEDDGTLTYPSNMYSTSLIRSYLTGSAYIKAKTDTALTAGAQNATWNTFAKQYDKLIATPSEIAYQETESVINYQSGWTCCPNDAYGVPNPEKWYDYSSNPKYNYNYITKPIYDAWKSDKLWLPSITETGTSGTNGLWGVDRTVCSNSSGSWLRSGGNGSAGRADYLRTSGGHDFSLVNDAYAVRPALHLNLKSAASAAGLFVDKPTLSKTTTAYSASAQTFTISSVTNLAITLPTGWTRSGGTVTIPANAPVGGYNIIITPSAGYAWADGSVGALSLPIAVTGTTIAAPTLSKTHTAYSASAQTFTISSYTGMNIALPNGWSRGNGTITIPAGALPGNYEVVVTPLAGYVWAGGGTGSKVLPIAVTSATASTPSLSKTSTGFSTSSQTFTVGSSALTGVTLTLPNGWSLSAATVTIPAKAAVGNYTITASANKGYAFPDGTTVKSYSMTITPATISAITWSDGATSFAYTGSPIVLNASATGVGALPVVVTGDNVNAGTFTVTAVNVNPNYVFASSLSATKTITITKQAITAVNWSVANNSGFEYDTQNHAPTASFTAANGQIYNLPVTLQKGGASVNGAVDAGSYTATVAAGTYATNFTLAAASTVNFTVNPREVQIDWGTETFTYTGGNLDTSVNLGVASGLLGGDTLTLTATYKSGDKKNVTDAGFVMEAAISGTSSNYKLPSVKTHTYKIAPLILAGVTASVQGTYTYNGSILTPEINLTGGNVVTGDTVKAFVSGGGIDAGTHTATVIGVANPNYSLDGTVSASFTVKPRDITASDIKWNITDNQEFTYDGSNRAPEATFVYNGVTYALTTDLSEAYNASATAYTANVAAGVFQNNFNLVDLDTSTPTGNAATVSFKINKAKITANDVEWSFTEGFKFPPETDPAMYALFRFNNTAFVLGISYTDENGNAVATGGDGSQWKTGVYTATVALGSGAEFDNFVLDGTISRTFKITESAAGTYTVIWEGFNSVVNYNGADQKPNAYVIVDGEKLDVTVSVEKWDGSAWVAATAAMNAGAYRFTATRTNYQLSNDKVELRIDPRVISVDYKNLTGLTHGATENVTATTTDPVAKAEFDAGKLNFAVSGSGHVAGTHVVSVVPQVEDGQSGWIATNNYSISNATAVQTIGKKVLTINDVEWKLDFTYDGNVKIPEGKVKINSLTLADQAGGAYLIFEFVYAVDAGSYQVKVLGVSNDNYAYNGEVELIVNELEVTDVKWEGVQTGGSVTFNKQDQAPKAYFEVGGEKVYLESKLEKYDAANDAWNEVAYALNAGSYRVTVEAIAQGTGNWFVAETVNTFTVSKFEISEVYLTKNVFTYDGNTPAIEVYAIGANNERIIITNATVLDGLGNAVTAFSDAGTYVVQVQAGVLGSNANYTVKSLVATGFVINPQLVNVTFEITGGSWSWKVDAVAPTVTVRASVANAVEVKFGKFGADTMKPSSSNHGLSYSFNITGMTGDGIITATVTDANYQISGASVQTFNVIPVDGTAQATFLYDGSAWGNDNIEIIYDETNGKIISVTGDNDVEIKFYKDGVLLASPITSTAGLDAGTYLVTVSCSTRELTTNITATTRTFKILPKEVDFSGVKWVINGVEVASGKVTYNGQIYNATLALGDLADKFEAFYTNGSVKNVGAVNTTVTVVSKNKNYTAVNVTESYSWEIEAVATTVAWNDDGTVASVTGDSAQATGGSFFEKDGSAYKVVYKKGGAVLGGAPTEAGDYTAEVVLALGNDGNVEVTAQSFNFSIGIPPVSPDGNSIQSWWWILLLVITVISIFFAIIALIVASKKKKAMQDDDGFYDDVTEDDLKW